jgi:hypothetical protein
METEIVPETSASFNLLTRLIAKKILLIDSGAVGDKEHRIVTRFPDNARQSF